MRTGIRRGLRTELPGSLLFGGLTTSQQTAPSVTDRHDGASPTVRFSGALQ